MQLKAGEIAKTLGIDDRKFRAKRGWCGCFMCQAGLSLRCQTLFCPKLPTDSRWKITMAHSLKTLSIITSALDDTQGCVGWENTDTEDCDMKSDSEELDLVIT